MKDVMNLNDVDCWHCHSSTCQQSKAVATPDSVRLTVTLLLGYLFKHLGFTFHMSWNFSLFFLNFLCRRLLLGSWEVSMNSISFSQVDQLGPSITIGNHVFVTFQNNLIQPPSHISLFTSWTHSHGPLHYCWITLQKPIWMCVTCKVRT